MKHMRVLSRTPALAQGEEILIIGKLASAVTSIYMTVWFTKNWQDIANTVNDIVADWSD